MKKMNWLIISLLALSLQAQAQQTPTVTLSNNPAVDENGPSPETTEFSGADAESGPGFRIWGRTWVPSAFNASSVQTDKMSNGGLLSTYSYLTFGTRIADNLRFKLRLPFIYNSAGTDRRSGDKQNDDQLMMQDLILELSSSNFLLIPFDVGIYWEGRLYLPTSPSSRQSDLIAHLRSGMILEKKFTHVMELEYQQKLDYYQQSRRVVPVTFRDENDFEVNTTSNTKKWAIDHWFTLWTKVAPRFSVGPMIGQEQAGYNQSRAEGKFRSDERLYKIGPQLRYQTLGGSRFILSYEDKVDRDANEAELGRFLTKNTQISLLSWLSF